MIALRAISNTVIKDEKNILLALLYFDIFNYPLTQHEIESFSPQAMEGNWQSSLTSLSEKRMIHFIDGFYSLHNNDSLIIRRKAGNRLAENKIKVAKRISKIISLFPFVRSVMLSGSISKGYMEKESDIDYFIITEEGRLWIVRGLMAFIRRLFFLNSHKYLCTNYFIDVTNLEIAEKNIFTAIEIATLKPMTGKSYALRFQQANMWHYDYLPNQHPARVTMDEPTTRTEWIAERIMKKNILGRIDQWIMKKFISRWRSIQQHQMNEKDFSIAFQSNEHVSRSHPEFYQKKVLSSYTSKITEFEKRFSISLHE